MKTGRVFLFSGHMIDRPDRAVPRFPADCEDIAAARIGEALDILNAQPGDVAFAQAAAGGDILFDEACLARGLDLRILLPLPEPDFIAASILPSGDGKTWLKRYQQLRTQLQHPMQVLPEDKDGDPFERCNQWLLDSALALGAAQFEFICLWDGAGGDGIGGTAHMVEQVRQKGGRVTWLDTRRLWPPPQQP